MGLREWSGRLLAPQRALELTGDWPLTATYELAELSQFEGESGPADERPDQWQINLRCSTLKGFKLDNPAASAGLPAVACGQSVAMVAAAGQAFTTSIGDLMSGILRHAVTAHNLSLSGAPQQQQQAAQPAEQRAAAERPAPVDLGDDPDGDNSEASDYW